jgi:hypothetical protein
MASSKKLTCKGTLGQVFICLSPEPHTFPSQLHAVFEYTVYLFTQGRRGRGGEIETERREEGLQFTKLCRNTSMTDCISSL